MSLFKPGDQVTENDSIVFLNGLRKRRIYEVITVDHPSPANSFQMMTVKILFREFDGHVKIIVSHHRLATEKDIAEVVAQRMTNESSAG